MACGMAWRVRQHAGSRERIAFEFMALCLLLVRLSYWVPIASPTVMLYAQLALPPAMTAWMPASCSVLSPHCAPPAAEQKDHVARALVYGLSGAAAVCGLAAHDPARSGAAVTPAACEARRRAGGLLRVRRRCRLPPLFELAQQRQWRQLPYTRPPWRKLPVTGTRAARLRP